MVNRLVLNLSHIANSSDHSTFRSRTDLGPPVFASNNILGNIGAPVSSSFGSAFDVDLDEMGRASDNVHFDRDAGELATQLEAVEEICATEKYDGEVVGVRMPNVRGSNSASSNTHVRAKIEDVGVGESDTTDRGGYAGILSASSGIEEINMVVTPF